MRLKRFLAFVVAFAMVMSIVPAMSLTAFASESVSDEASLKAALQAGSEVVLGGDIVVNATIEIPAGVTATLDLNGSAITSGYQTGSDSKHIYPIDNYGNLTIKDSKETGSITGRGIYNRDGATITVNDAKIVSEDWNGGACIWSYGTGKVYLNNATLVGYTGCISSEGPVEINGGTYTCYSGIDDDGNQKSAPTYNIRAYNGLKIDGNPTMTSRHGVISIGGGNAVIENGSYTIEFASNTTSNVVYIYGNADVTIKDGEFLSDNTSGKADSGAAVLVSGSDAKLTIDDGTFVGMNGMVSGNANTVLNGGNYSTVWDYNHYGNIENFVAEGAVVVVNGEAMLKNADGTSTKVVAAIGKTPYDSLAEAVNEANAGDVVVLYQDVESLPVIKAAITIDGNGHNVAKTAGELQFGTIDGTVTLKNLVFTDGNEAIRTDHLSSGNYSDMTLVVDNCTFNNLTTYAIMGGKTDPDNHVLGELVVKNSEFNAVESNGNYMVYAQCVNTLTVTGCTFNGNDVTKGAIHTGDSTAQATVATISGNKINGVARGVQIGNRVTGSSVAVDNNTFTNVTTAADSKSGAVYVHGNADENVAVSVTNNTATGCTQVMYNDKNTADGDHISNIIVKYEGNTKDGKAIYIDENGNDTETAPVSVSGTFMGGHMNTNDPAETFITTEIENLKADEEVIVKIYSGEALIATSKLLNKNYFVIDALGVKTCLTGSSGTWETKWEEGMPRADYPPTSGTLYVDTIEMNSAEIKMRDVNDNVIDWATLPGVKANADWVISNADEFKAFAAEVNGGNTYSGKVVVLANDIDLEGSEENLWTPIGTNADAIYFAGTFDGQGYTISNLYVKQGAAYHAAGLFGAVRGTVKNFTVDTAYVESLSSGAATDNGTAVVAGSTYCGDTHRVENVHVKNATVKGNRYVAGIVGYMDGTVTNCSVENVTIVATPDNLTGSYDNGDKVGGIVGYCNSQSVEITNCELKGNVDITAYRDVAGIVGCASTGVKVNNNTNNAALTITIDTTLIGERDSYNVGEFVGRNTPAENTGNERAADASYETTVVKAPKVYEVATKTELDNALKAAVDGDTILLTADIDYGTTQLAITKAITLDLGEKTLTTRNAYGGMSIKNGPSIKNGTIVHASNTAAIKVWNAVAFEDLVIDVQGKGDANKTIGGIVLQESAATRVDTIKNVTIKGVALTNGIETYNCGNATENVIGSMENVTIDAQGTGMLISAPCGTATNCDIKGGISGIELWIKGTYSASIDLVKSTVEGGTQTLYVHDEFKDGVVNNGTLTFTMDEETVLVSENGAVATVINAHESAFEIEEDVYENVVATIGNANYTTLASAIKSAKENDTIQLLAGEFSEGTIKMPAELKNVTIKGAEGKASVLKDMTIMAADGNSIVYDSLAFDGIVFDNSRISITGWRSGEVDVKNFTVTNCEFKNLDDTTSSAPVHINLDSDEAIENFTFTNNVIDGATGGSKSGIYAQCTGDVLVEGNVINNVAFRPYVIQITTDDGIEDNFTVTNNTFSGSAQGRAQGLGNNAEGTDKGTVVVTENIFKDITSAQQICYWSFNEATTTATLEKNYYDIDIAANPNKIYYNKAAASVADLMDMGIYPIYTKLNADGTIDKTSLYTPPYGSNSPAYTKEVDGYVRVWGEGGGNAKESFVLKLYSNDTHIATTELNNIDGILDGDVYVTWNFYYPNSTDNYWTTTWEEGHPNSAAQPTRVELWIDGVMVCETAAKMNAPDDLAPVNWEELGGVKYVVTGLKGSGTEKDPYLINNLDELKWFRDKVDEQAADGTTQFAGKYFLLTDNIDLAGINWNPIGSKSGDHGSFKGVFDGGNKTIYNLYVEQAGEGLGLFAYTADNALIKNLTLENVTVKSTDNSSYVGGVVGNAAQLTGFENVHVKGNIDISGRGYVGGINGHGYNKMNNVSVIGEGTISSTFWCAGGIIGYAGEGYTDITNATVEGTGETGLVIRSAAGGLGSIVGMAEDNEGTQPIAGSNLTAKNILIETYTGAYGDAYANYALGYLYGGNETSILTGDLTVENVTIKTSSGEEPQVVDAVAEINGAIYFDLQAAIAAVGEGDVVIELLSDATMDYDAREAYGTEATTSVTINGNGHTLTLNQKDSDWSSIGLANADAKLVLNDMIIEKTGYGDTSGAWNTHTINFTCEVKMTDVTVNNSMSVEDGAELNNVTINEAGEYYGLWIKGNGQTVTVNGGAINATNSGRGIKIADEYVDSVKQVTLTVDGTEFNTAKKAAVLVSSTAGAKVTATNADITKVAADSENFVWVDEDWAAYYNNVKVYEEATKAQESEEDFLIKVWYVNGEGAKSSVRAYYNTLDELFAAPATQVPGSNYIELRGNVVANEKVNVSYGSNRVYTFGTEVEGGVTMDFKFADDWNLLPKFDLGENITMNVPYLQVIGGDIEIAGTINTTYLYLYGTGEGVTITETGVVNANTGDATVQVKGGTVLTVNGELNTAILNVWTQDVNNSTLVVSGNKAEVNVTNNLDAWNGYDGVSAQKVVVENGAVLTAKSLNANRGSEVTVDAATLTADTLTLGYDSNIGTLEVINGGVVTNGVVLGSVDSTVEGSEDMNVTTSLEGYKVVYKDGVYSVAEKAQGTITYGYTNQSSIWGEGGSNSKESFIVELYVGEDKIAQTSLNNINGIIDGDVYVTWSIPFAGSDDGYWEVKWFEAPSKDRQPTTVKLWVDGECVAENEVQMNGPDDLNPVVWEELDIFKNYVAENTTTGVMYESLAEALKTAKDGETVTIISDGTYTFPGGTQDITLEAAEGVNATIDMKQKKPNLNSANVTFNNLTFEYVSEDYYGMQHSGDITYNNCHFTGKMFLYGDKVEFNGCDFTQDVVDYNVWTYAADEVVFTDCEFNCVGKCVLVYNDGDGPSNVTFVRTTMTASAPCSTKAAIEISSEYIAGYHTVNIDSETTATGFATDTISGNSLWNDKYANTASYVYVDGVQVWPKKNPAADVQYGAYAATSGTAGEADYRENIQVDMYDVYAEESLVVELWSGETKVATTTMRDADRDDQTEFARPIEGTKTANIVVYGRLAGSWDTVWHVLPTEKNVPDTIKVYADGELVDTHDAFTNEDEKAEYTGFVTVERPTAEVTEVTDEDAPELTFAMNFKAVEPEDKVLADKQLKYYGDWYADYVLTVNKDVTFNANGEADGYLAGQYDSFNTGWVMVPDGDVTVKANEGFRIMKYAAEMLEQPGLNITYNDVVNFVKDFDCGVFFEPEFIIANPDLEVTLELKMYNPENEAESYVIGKTYEFEAPEYVASIEDAEGTEYYTTLQAAIDAVVDAEKVTITLLKNVDTDITIGGDQIGAIIDIVTDNFTFTGKVTFADDAILMIDEKIDTERIVVTGEVEGNDVAYGYGYDENDNPVKYGYAVRPVGVNAFEGAQVRIGNGVNDEGKVTGTDSGLRFITKVDRSDSLAGEDNAAFGVRITAEGSDTTTYIPTDDTKWQDSEKTVFTSAVTKLLESNYNRKYQATPYVVIDGVMFFGGASAERSIYQVAAGLLVKNVNDSNYDYDEGVLEGSKLYAVLNAYVNQTGIRLSLTSEGLTEYTGTGTSAYSGEQFFEVLSSETVSANVYTITIKPVGEKTTINSYWQEYIRINNNHSAIASYTSLDENTDGSVTITFDYAKYIAGKTK